MDNTVHKEEPEFSIQKIYTKDLSFESPNTPNIFMQEFKPEFNINLQTIAKPLEENIHEIVLTVTVTAKSEGKVAYLCEVQEAGIFSIKNFPKEQMGSLQGSVCPGILFPYAREVISDLVMRGGFPQLCLAPINFDALYAQQLEQQQQSAENTETVG